MILNPFQCPNCGNDLQPEDILLGVYSGGELIRCCAFCRVEF
jgi:hypothetical protein